MNLSNSRNISLPKAGPEREMVSNNFDLSRALLNCNRGGPSCSLGLKWEGVVRDVDVSKSQRHEPRRSKAKGCTPPKQPLTVPLPQRVFQLAVNEAQQELVPLRRLHLPQPAGVQSLGFFFSSRRRHTRSLRDWSSDVCSSDWVNRRHRRSDRRRSARFPGTRRQQDGA